MSTRAARRPGRWPAWALALAVALSALLAACGGSAKLTGTDLGQEPAPDFTLTDHRGQTVSLSQLRGKAVALTFIYTHCPDICPLITQHLAQAYAQLPKDAQARVALVAITVDPARDTPEVLQAYSAQHGLADNPHWFALTGDAETLAPVWASYYIDPGAIMAGEHAADHGTPADGNDHADQPDHPGMPAAGSGDLIHTDAIFLIDREGRWRVLLRSETDPQTIAKNLEILAG
ncbi:MAG: SCO family protein [Sphaerobacter sp.]|nr:SCO family protein [Sphaerobacter sp.]